jgi:serine/threonine protein phosphatase PrpC
MWLPPIACSVIGASHQRKGKPCQDASLSRSFISKDGEELHLMVVSDGHGGESYWLSDVGSRLACQEAAKAVEAAVKQNCLDSQAHWQHLLAEELPRAIHSQWLEAIHQDWQNQPNCDPQDFSPQLYGCTLGLVLLAPQWWGYSGLGDWDLVVIQDGTAELVSEEQDFTAAGEATASLSMADAVKQFNPRCKLMLLDQAQDGLKLLVSTDGIRKSCATDDDFRALCICLAELNQTKAIREALAEITSQGSGDDVSVVICMKQGGVGNALGASENPQFPLVAGDKSYNTIKYKSIGALATLVAVSFFTWKTFSGVKKPTSSLSPEAQMQDIKAAVSLLCANPALITKSLDQNQRVFEQLSSTKANPQILMREARQNRIAALIAYSKAKPGSRETLNLQALDNINSCPELKSELEQRWLEINQFILRHQAPLSE